jgi:hypothetical protein
MPKYDTTAFRNALTDACRIAFTKLRACHKNEAFYCIGLFTSGEFAYLLPTAMTEQGLNQVARKYQSKPRYASMSLQSLCRSLRWSPCDSPLHLEGEGYFGTVSQFMDEISSILSGIDTGRGWEEFEAVTENVLSAICDVLKGLDREGVFGFGQEREKIFVSVLMGDQDDSILTIGRRLNPDATVRQFEKEWEEWGRYWKSK